MREQEEGMLLIWDTLKLQFWISEITAFDEEAILLVREDSNYGKKVSIQIGNLNIDTALDLATEDELKKFNYQWKRGRMANVLAAKSVQKTSQGQFHLAQIRGNVKLNNMIEIHPFEASYVYGLSRVKEHNKRVLLINHTQNL